MPIDAPFTEITAVAPDIADILLSGTWKIAAAVYDEPALMLTFFNCKISFFNNVADSATVLSPTVNLIETPFDDVLAVICELPLFQIQVPQLYIHSLQEQKLNIHLLDICLLPDMSYM